MEVKARLVIPGTKWPVSPPVNIYQLIGTLQHKNFTPDQDVIIQLGTGLEDPTGVEIFEGDVVRYTPPKGKTKRGRKFIDMEVVWRADKAKFALKFHEHPDLEFGSIENACHANHAVIGDIYTNPELLK